MYCSINEAWGDKNSPEKITERYNNNFKQNNINDYNLSEDIDEYFNDSYDYVEKDNNSIKNITQPEYVMESFEQCQKNIDCKSLIKKILKCNKCKKILKKKFQKNIISGQTKYLFLLLVIILMIIIIIMFLIKIFNILTS